jgi:DNA-binding response OmpR family regulator
MESRNQMAGPKPLILMVDDNRDLLDVMERALTGKGFQTLAANDGLTGLEAFQRHHPDLVILDVMMPGMNGLEVCRKLRSLSNVPIIMLTIRGQEVDVVRGLKTGADDYIVKPFSVGELVGRIRALLRRTWICRTKAETSGTAMGDWLFVHGSNQVLMDERAADLTPTEFRLLLALAERVGHVVPHRELLTEVWGEKCGGETKRLKVYIHHLRQKIEEDPKKPRHVLNERGIGYKLVI